MLFKRKNDVVVEFYDFYSSFVVCRSVFSDNVNCAACDVNPTYKRKKDNTGNESAFKNAANNAENLVCKSLSLRNEEAKNAGNYLTNQSCDSKENCKYCRSSDCVDDKCECISDSSHIEGCKNTLYFLCENNTVLKERLFKSSNELCGSKIDEGLKDSFASACCKGEGYNCCDKCNSNVDNLSENASSEALESAP